MRSPPSAGYWFVRAVGLGAVAVFLGLVARFWHPVYGFTAFLQMDHRWEAHEISAFREYPVFVYDTPDDYDGLQYAQIACHPLLIAPELQSAVDNLAYRARRILLPATAWVLGAGRPGWIPNVYASLNIACWLVLAGLLWRVLTVTDTRGLVAWLGVLFSAGALGSVRFALTDLPAATLVVAAIAAAECSRPRAAIGWLAAAVLTRETALVAWPGLWPERARSRRAIAGVVLAGAAVAVPLALWMAYIRWRTVPVNEGWSNFTWPLAGFVAQCAKTLGEVAHAENLPFSWGTLATLAGLGAQLAFLFLRPRTADRWWRVGTAHAALLLVLGAAVWAGFPIAAARVLLPLTIACNLLAARTRAPWSWLVACNLTIIAGLMSIWGVPLNPREIAAARHGAVAGVVRLGPGWYNREEDHHHRWSWAQPDARLTIVTWPPAASVAVRLRFRLSAPAPRTVVVRADGREVWRGAIGTALSPVSLPPTRTNAGRLDFEFATDAAPKRESESAGGRRLAFALYDPVLSVSVSEAADP